MDPIVEEYKRLARERQGYLDANMRVMADSVANQIQLIWDDMTEAQRDAAMVDESGVVGSDP